MTKKIYEYRILSLLRVFIYLFVPTLIMMQPVYFMDHISLCIIKKLFGFDCLFCGMTRAFVHILHFDFVGALHYNSLSMVVFLIICFIVIIDCINIAKSMKIS